jgi:hypothetical protein
VTWRFGASPGSPDYEGAPEYVKDAILKGSFLFGQFFGAFSDSLEHFFELALLLGRDILKCTPDSSHVLAEKRNEYPVSLLRK